MRSTQREVLDPTGEICGFPRCGYQLEVVNALADGHVKLMSVHQPGERAIRPLPLCRFHQQIRVPRKQDAPQRASSVQKFWVGQGTGVVLLSREDIDAPGA